MRKVVKLLGPPGTGKTTWLIAELKRLLKSGVSPDRVAFVSFSRRAIREAKDHARQLSECASSELPHFRTIHSTAYHLIGLGRGDVVDDKALSDFGEAVGMPCATVSTDEGPWEGTVGARILALIALAAARGTSLEHEWARVDPLDIPLILLQRTASQYARYKDQRAQWDFNDMVVNAVGTLDVDVLFVDEAQDTSAAQWRFIRSVTRDVPLVYLAGDDDQAVYTWSGADPDQFMRIKAESRVLPHSYRLPASIKHLADTLAQRITRRVPKDFTAREAEGSVQYVNELSHLNLHEGMSWLLMARSNYQLRMYREMARQQGVVYTLPDGNWSWTLPPVRAAVAYESLRKGETVSAKDVRDIASYCTSILSVDVSRERYAWSQVFAPTVAKDRTWMEALDGLGVEDREYIRALRRGGESLTKEGRVRISTIHGAKGAEAERCVLVSDISARVAAAARSDPDAESRVQYVGVTRAKSELTILQPRTVTFWDI